MVNIEIIDECELVYKKPSLEVTEKLKDHPIFKEWVIDLHGKSRREF